MKLSISQQLHRITSWALILNLFFLQSYLIRFSIGSYPSNLQELMVGFLLFAFLAWQISERNFLWTLKHLTRYRYFLAFVGLSLLSVLFIPLVPLDITDPINLLREGKFLFFALLLAFIFLEFYETPDQRKGGLMTLGWGAVSFGVFSVFFNLLGYNVPHDFRLQGPLDSAVWLAFYTTPFFLLFLITWFEDRRKMKYLFATLLLGFTILATRSAAAIGGAFFLFTIYLYQQHRYLFHKRMFQLVLLLLTVSITIFVVRTKVIPSFESRWSSLNDRSEVWKVATVFLQDPQTAIFGLGMGQYQDNYQNRAEGILGQPPQGLYPLQPHNVFLLFWFQFGILGAVFMLFCFMRIFTMVFFSKKPMSSSELTVLLMLSYLFLHGQIDIPFFKNDLMFLLLLFLELSLRTDRRMMRG